MNKIFKRGIPLLIPGLLALSACDTPPVTTTTDNLGGLTLPSSNPSASSIPSSTPSASASSTPTASPARVSNIMVWEVRPQGQTQPVSYLTATVHAPLASGYSLPAAFTQQLSASKAFYMEADVDQVDQLLAQLTPLAVDTSLNNEVTLGASYWQKLQDRLTATKVNIPLNALQVLKPWFVNLIMGTIPEATPPDPNTILDLQLRARARQSNIPVRYLEAAIDQFNAMQAVSGPEHLRLIKDNLDQGLEQLISERDQVFALYNRGDLAGLEKLEAEARLESSEYFENILRKRNQKWLVTLKKDLKTQPSFVAVGALHLIGSDGLVKQLQDDGFEVKALSYK